MPVGSLFPTFCNNCYSQLFLTNLWTVPLLNVGENFDVNSYLWKEPVLEEVLDFDLEIEYAETDQCDITDDAASLPDNDNGD